MFSDFAQRFVNELNEKLPDAADLLPKKEFKAALNSALERMDLVTREEFDAQAAVLLRTRERLEALEKQLTELQTNLDRQKPQS
ncbi:accessory factor UbiK family protein [Marinimicrobium sp. ABcell2]|uniref:accessory factor UbiK family protein n=1 Tax=Marinimicrobium sp. ABcell2 TaxID=3069751 RepID=UPI0027B33367|nr:accessory factor UbiK family protein [Marinimicrobium sp. ABcell2]MDQ2078382.1 accessory factor UbiK family protein [Marinimicrobium sp. ABcell2]